MNNMEGNEFKPVLSDEQMQENISDEREVDVSDLFPNTIEQEEPQESEPGGFDASSEHYENTEHRGNDDGSKNESLAKTAQVILENSSKFIENLLFGVPSSKCYGIKQAERLSQQEAIKEYLDSVEIEMTPLQKVGATILPMFAFSVADGFMKNSSYEGGLYDKWTKGKKHRAKKEKAKSGENSKSTKIVRRKRV